MIIGSGIIAKVFQATEWCNDDYLVIASGVSNSTETRLEAYKREEDLIRSLLPTDKWVIYFSTVSIFQKEKEDTLYVKHKVKMEQYLMQNCPKLLVLRLPIVVSKENNPNQLIGYLNSKIANKEVISILSNTTRYFFLLAEIPKAAKGILDFMQRNSENQMAINVGFNQQITMNEVGELIENKFPDVPIVKMNEGKPYYVDFNRFEEIVKSEGLSFQSSNPVQILKQNLG